MQCLGYMVYAANTQGDAMGYSLFGLSSRSYPQTTCPCLAKSVCDYRNRAKQFVKP